MWVLQPFSYKSRLILTILSFEFTVFTGVWKSSKINRNVIYVYELSIHFLNRWKFPGHASPAAVTLVQILPIFTVQRIICTFCTKSYVDTKEDQNPGARYSFPHLSRQVRADPTCSAGYRGGNANFKCRRQEIPALRRPR
jgi:hypothetical protein